jgi:hypothetical protein
MTDTQQEILRNVLVEIRELKEQVKQLQGTAPLKRLNQRIGEHKSWGWWAQLFHLVRHSKFLIGQKSGAEDFHVSLWWVLGPKNLAKALMGEYTDLHHTEGAINGHPGPSKLEHWADEWESGPDLSGHTGSAVTDASTH